MINKIVESNKTYQILAVVAGVALYVAVVINS